MLCRDNFEEEKDYLNKLSWENSQFMSEQYETMIKNSLARFQKTKYLTNTSTKKNPNRLSHLGHGQNIQRLLLL